MIAFSHPYSGLSTNIDFLYTLALIVLIAIFLTQLLDPGISP